MCMLFCEHGNKIGEEGCPVCQCNPPPIGGMGAPPVTSIDESQPMLGGAADLHGCYRTAGYDWCRKTNKCIRLFEQPDGFDYGVDCGDEDDAQYFAAGGKPEWQAGRHNGMGYMGGTPDKVNEADVTNAMMYGTKIDPKEDAASPASVGVAISGMLLLGVAAVVALLKARRSRARRGSAMYSDLNAEFDEWTQQGGQKKQNFPPPSLEEGELDGEDEDLFNKRGRYGGASFPETVSDDFMEPASIDDHSPLKIVLPTIVETDVDAMAAFKLPRSPAKANDD